MLDLDKLTSLMRDVAAEIIMPRYQALGAGDVEEKAKGDLVTIADREAEWALTPALMKLVPGSVVVGEEATAANPQLLEVAQSDQTIWYVDPIDGTANFVNGLPSFATMIALAVKGEVRQSAIYFPVHDTLYVAEKGAGAFVQESGHGMSRLKCRTTPTRVAEARAAFYTKHFPEFWEAGLHRLQAQVASGHTELAAACEYTDISSGRKDLATYHRMLPWDHAPGSLILREAGGVSRNVETREDHRPAHIHGPHILAATEDLWASARELMT